MAEKFYVTTPIYYVNARPHLGSLYSTLLADVAARYHKLLGERTFFLTGTDEHGQKIAQTAEKAGMQPKPFVDQFIQPYKDLWKRYNIDYSYFVRTTDTAHVTAVQAWLQQLIDSGDIYLATYSGYYCTPCETYITEKDLETATMANGVPLCLSCTRPTEYISEESYFFKLSAYQERLLQFYRDNPDFITPAERMAEVVSFVQGGLKDLSISRTTVTWGIPFPGNDKHVTYVWADALNNYITAIGYGDPARVQEFNQWWPADLQVMGKDIVRFHAVYWPAFLMASKLQQPKKLLVHGWIKIGENKMSKSLGNAVDPEQLADKYGVDAVRAYLVKNLAVTHDAPFTYEDLEQRTNADLVNDLSNLVYRFVSLASAHDFMIISAPREWSDAERNLHAQSVQMLLDVQREMQNYYFHRAYAHVWRFIHQVNTYFHSQEPWKVIKQSPQDFMRIMSATAHALHTIAHVCWPLMPDKMQTLLLQLGTPLALHHHVFNDLEGHAWNRTFTLTKVDMLFKKIEQDKVLTPTASPSPEVITPPEITIQEFTKVQLRIGKILEVSIIEKSEKLYALYVDFGTYGKRQVLSGVRKQFSIEQLVDKQALFVFNLQPRAMMGTESHGMLLVARDEADNLVLMRPEHPVPNGALLG